ncbi:MAG: HlyD family efflux transporter periplasmic adaptor subunit [Paracoccaceae bacterium]
MTFRRLAVWAVPLALLAAGLVWAFRPVPVPVDLTTLRPGPLEVTIADEGRARIRDVYVVSAPVRGRVLRIEVEEGDPVVGGETVIAELEPVDPDFLDPRAEAEARAAVETARAALTLARARVAEAQADLDFAAAEVRRMRELESRGTVPMRALEEAERGFLTREAALATAEAAIEMRRSELGAARIRLMTPEERVPDGACPCITLTAPADGTVLRLFRESEGVAMAGEPLAEIGDPRDLEVVAEFLSADAVRIEPGMPARIENWGGEPLAATVRRVEPYAYPEVSALGIEERRVEVRLDFEAPQAARARLGHGYQVEARVILWSDDDALAVPLTALMRGTAGWSVWTVEDGTARRRAVEIGRRAELSAEVVSGLSPGDVVVRYPSEAIGEGMAVEAR